MPRRGIWIKVISGLTTLLTGAKILLNWLGDADFLIERIHNPGWLGEIYNHLINFSPQANMIIFLISLVIFGYFVRSNRQAQSIKANWNSLEEFPKRIDEIRKRRFEQQWNDLDEQDKEIVRELFFKGKLSDRQIMEMLKANRVLFYEGAFTPISDRVSFIKKDFAGFNIIIKEFHPLIQSIIEAEEGEGSGGLSPDSIEIKEKGTERISDLPDWRIEAPILEFQPDFHKRVEVFDNNHFIGHKTIYWVKVKRKSQTPYTSLACTLKSIVFIFIFPKQPDFPYPQNGDIILHSNQGPLGGVELSELHPEQIFNVVSRIDGSRNIMIEGYSPNDATVEFPYIGKSFV